jgi:lactate dehydrogenase-like 2-hydroxyacid dehydrogenase
MNQIHAMRVFVRVSETESFRRAAQQLDVSNALVTRAIAMLEAHLRTRLIMLQDDVLARLLSFPNVIVTSHQAFFTREALNEIAITTLGNVKAWFEGSPRNQVLP